MKNIKDYNLEELKKEFIELGEKPFRAEQVFKWIHEANVKEFDEMTNISLELREKLKQNYTMCIYKIIKNEGKTAIMVTHDIAEAISLINMTPYLYLYVIRKLCNKKESFYLSSLHKT